MSVTFAVGARTGIWSTSPQKPRFPHKGLVCVVADVLVRMAVVVRFFRWVWKKITQWIFFWKHRTPLLSSSELDPNQPVSKRVEKCDEMADSSTEGLALKVTDLPRAAVPAQAKTPLMRVDVSTERRTRSSLLQLPRLAMESVSTFMLSALQNGWQKCTWKTSVSSRSVSSRSSSPKRAASSLESEEAEMLREVYLVLWAMRRQLRQLARRQEQRRQRHHWASANAHSRESATGQAPKLDVRSPL